MAQRISARLLGCLFLFASVVFTVLRKESSSRQHSVALRRALAEPINATQRRRSLFALPHDSGTTPTRDDKACSKPVTLFIAIESSTGDRLGRMSARQTWLLWAKLDPSLDRREPYSQVKYAFFADDTIATRDEAAAHKDVVIVSKHGLPLEEVERREWIRKNPEGDSVAAQIFDSPPSKSASSALPRDAKRGTPVVKVGTAPKPELRDNNKKKRKSAGGGILSFFGAARSPKKIKSKQTRPPRIRKGRGLLGPARAVRRRADPLEEGKRQAAANAQAAATQEMLHESLRKGADPFAANNMAKAKPRELQPLQPCGQGALGGCVIQAPNQAYRSPAHFRFGQDSTSGLMSASRFWIMTWSASSFAFDFFLFLDISSSSSGGSGYGFLCLSSLVAELEFRPQERFLFKPALACHGGETLNEETALHHDRSFFLVSRDVVEVLREATSRVENPSQLLLDRLLARLPLTVLRDPKRLLHSSLAHWPDYSFRPTKTNSDARVCDNLVWVSDVSSNPILEKKTASASRNPHSAANATMQKIWQAHARYHLADWVRPQAEYSSSSFHTAFDQMSCTYDDITSSSKYASMPQSILLGTSTFDRELVTAVGLGLSLASGEHFLVDTQIVAAFIAPKAASPKISLSSSISEQSATGLFNSWFGSTTHREASRTMLETTPNSIGDRSRLKLWNSALARIQPVVDVCSFDVDCIWDHLVNEHLPQLWQDADRARIECCCSARISEAPLECSAFKTRRYFEAENLPSSTEDELFGRHPLPPMDSILEETDLLSSSEAYNWTMEDEHAWMSAFKRRSDFRLLQALPPVRNIRGVTVLASFPGSGNTWARLLLEYASGIFTGSIYHDLALAPLLPAEGDNSSRVLAVKTQTFPDDYVRQLRTKRKSTDDVALKALPLMATSVRRVILLVRHPFDAIWSEYQRRRGAGGNHIAQVSQLNVDDFRAFAGCMACRWTQYMLKHVALASDPASLFASRNGEDVSGVRSGGSPIRLHLLFYERLHGARSFHDELASVLAFLGLNPPSPDRLACVPHLARRSDVHRRPQLKALDIFRFIPGLSCHAWGIIKSAHQSSAFLLRLFGYDNYVKEDLPCEDTGNIGSSLCIDVLSRPGIAPQECSRSQAGKFGSIPIPNAHRPATPDLLLAPEEDDQVVSAMNLQEASEELRPKREEKDLALATANGSAAALIEEESEVWHSFPLKGSTSAAVEVNATLTAATGEGGKNEKNVEEEEEVRASPPTVRTNGDLLKHQHIPEANATSQLEYASEPVIDRVSVADVTMPEVKMARVVKRASVIQSKKPGTATETAITAASSGGKCPEPRGSKEFPLVAVLVSTTSRGVVKTGNLQSLTADEKERRLKWVDATTKALKLKELVLFTTMLPSLARSLDCGFRYRVVVGFDLGDVLFDTAPAQARAAAWLGTHLVAPAALRGIEASYALLPVENPLQKPGPVFNAMAASVGGNHTNSGPEAAGAADYIYRVNDDTEFRNDGWATKFVAALELLGAPAFGVVGPSCPQGNREILTHDFTHKAHLAVFGTYYPPQLTDWWMDDWISRVYGARRTRLLTNVQVTHHSSTYGRRYDVNGKNRHLVDDLVAQGKASVLAYTERQGATPAQLEAYRTDRFNHRQLQKEVDQATLQRKSAAVKPPPGGALRRGANN